MPRFILSFGMIQIFFSRLISLQVASVVSDVLVAVRMQMMSERADTDGSSLIDLELIRK